MKAKFRNFLREGPKVDKALRVLNAQESESGETEIWIYGDLVDSYWFYDPHHPGEGFITVEVLKDALDLAKKEPVTLRIHSPGGDVMAASAMRSVLMSYPAKVTSRIDGLCASAATMLATAGDLVLMQDSAYFMIHDPWTFAMGSADELKAVIQALKEIKSGIVQSYQNRTGLEAAILEKMMSDETWMSAQKALELGFVDEVITKSVSKVSKDMAQAAARAMSNSIMGFERVPDEVKEMLEKDVPEEAASSAQLETTDTLPCEGEETRAKAVQALREKLDTIKKEQRYERF